MSRFKSSPKYQAARSTEETTEDRDTPNPKNARRPWEPGFFKRLPWAGVISIILALGCAVAAIVVGIVSDGKPLDYWTLGDNEVQPAVLLSIFATAANALLVFAFTQGATIHWWNSAFRGATLKQLHSSYHYGSGLTAVFVRTAFHSNSFPLRSIGDLRPPVHCSEWSECFLLREVR